MLLARIGTTGNAEVFLDPKDVPGKPNTYLSDVRWSSPETYFTDVRLRSAGSLYNAYSSQPQ